MIDVVVFGRGRMGSAAAAAFEEAQDLRVVAVVGTDSPPAPRADVYVDFTLPRATAAVASLAATHAKGLVVGTTGLDDDGLAAVDAASESLPVVVAPNLSTGIPLLIEFVRAAVRALPHADVEIVDIHHRHKIDAPSGTAAAILEAIVDARGSGTVPVHGRQGRAGPRAAGEVGVHSLRAGDVVGEHTVIIATEGERIELTHRASSRRAFAAGAVAAVRYLIGRSPGRYDMRDVLGLGRMGG